VRIDVHTHAFHPKIAAKVVGLLEQHYRIAPIGSGLVDDLLRRLDCAGIDACAVHSAATVPEQVRPANDWAIELQRHSERVISFGTIHPGYQDWEGEFDRLAAAGIRGIKLHPDFQGFRLDDPRLRPLFDGMQGRFTLMVHIGDALPPEQNPSCPAKLRAVMRQFSRLRVIAAHLGGYLHWAHVVPNLAGLDLYLDTSSSLFTIPQPLLDLIWRSFPRERFLFGSDYPLFDPGQEVLALQRRLRLSDRDVDAVLRNGAWLAAGKPDVPAPGPLSPS
jgi:predicted TIM-barrel fold metal-dependent hydrolase